MLIDVYTNWCKFCWKMDAEVYARPEVQEYLAKRFVTVKLNAESPRPAPYQGRSYTHRSLALAFGVNGYPTTVFLAPDGRKLVNVPGYVKADRFLLLLRYVGEGYLERGVPFGDFERTAARPSKKDG
jgi:thioredoxin-related protein